MVMVFERSTSRSVTTLLDYLIQFMEHHRTTARLTNILLDTLKQLEASRMQRVQVRHAIKRGYISFTIANVLSFCTIRRSLSDMVKIIVQLHRQGNTEEHSEADKIQERLQKAHSMMILPHSL